MENTTQVRNLAWPATAGSLEATITIERLSEGPLKGKSIRCLHCEKEAVFLVGFGRHDVGSGAFCEDHIPTPPHLP